MKTATWFILVMIFAGSSLPIKAQQTEEFYLNKIRKFESLQNVGVGLIIGSIPIGALGTVIMVKAEKDFKEENEESDFLSDLIGYSASYTIGFILVDLAVASLAGGITMVIIGSKKAKKYQDQFDNFKLGTYITPEHVGLTLTFRF